MSSSQLTNSNLFQRGRNQPQPPGFDARVLFQRLHRQSPASLFWFGVLDYLWEILMDTGKIYGNLDVFGRWSWIGLFCFVNPKDLASANGYYASRFTMLMPKARWHLAFIDFLDEDMLAGSRISSMPRKVVQHFGVSLMYSRSRPSMGMGRKTFSITIWANIYLDIIEGSLEAKLSTIWRDENGTARKKLGRGESQKGEDQRWRQSEERRCRCAKR